MYEKMFGFIGLLLVLVAYLKADKQKYFFGFSGVGSLLLTIHAFILKDIPFVLLQTTLALFCVVKLKKILRKER